MNDMKKRVPMRTIVLLIAFALAAAGCRTQPALDPEERVLDVFAGAANVFILRADASILAAGDNHAGQLGSGEIGRRDLAIEQIAGQARGRHLAPAVTGVFDSTGAPFAFARAAAAGESHALILREDGTLWGAGGSAFGELGRQGGNLPAFTQLTAAGAPVSGVSSAAAGNNSSFFIREGSLWATGFNHYGELGLGNRSTQFTFTAVESAGQNVRAIASGLRHTALLKEDGTLWVTGNNFKGQLGLGDTADRTSFTHVPDVGSGILAVAAGNHHTVILHSDGSVWAAGSNFWGQLGLHGSDEQHSFTRLNDANGRPLTGIRQIAARGDITLLLTSAGSLLLTGNYIDSQSILDIVASGANPAFRSAFAPLLTARGRPNLGEVQRIALGHNSIYVIDSNGQLWTAGSNRYGQLVQAFDTEISSVLRAVRP